MGIPIHNFWIIIIIIIIKICKIDKIWKEYFYHIPNQVNVPGLVTAAILAIILSQKWRTAFQSESGSQEFKDLQFWA